MGVCLSQDMVERYVAGNSSSDERRTVEAHIAKCEDCRQRIESAQSNMVASGQSESVTTHKNIADTVTEESHVDRNERPTKSMTEGLTYKPDAHISKEDFDSMFEGYKVIGQIGKGGASTVWRALQLSTQREVALKVLGTSTFVSGKARIRFEREVELTARLEHPNIARIYDSGLHRGVYYYAMELFEGEHLDKYIQGRQLTQRQILELIHIVCQAVQYAHQRGVIHRDLKPSNIIVTDDGQPHVLDFGLAKTFLEGDRSVAVSIDGDVVGTLAFMSPEQAAGNPDAIDTRTDVYSLGVILFYVLTNQWPYDISSSHYQALKNIQEQEPIRLSKIIPRFDTDIEAILLKALTKKPPERYQSVAELAHDIQSWLEGLPIVARSVSSLYLLRKVIARHRYTSTVVALLLIIVFSFSCVYYHLYSGLCKSNAKLKRTLQSLSKESKNYLALAQQVAFTHLLDMWHDGRTREAKLGAKYFSRGTREAEANDFLSDPRPLKDKVTAFRQKLKDREPFFVEFIIAEHYLKEGNRAEAAKAYRECLLNASDSGKDELLRMRVKLRLYELTGKNSRSKIPNVAED